ncbi:MAG: RNA polymerase sigma factor [Bacteroidetes bacterium]|nr:RNA polymerase sigma factor [Bacteroidota bacterium]
MSSELQQKHDHFLSLLTPIRTSLARFCRAITSDDDAARDLASETILVAYEHLETLRDPSRFRSYCFQIASRHAKRSRWRERNRVAYDATFAEALADTGPSPETSAEVRLLYEALDTLPTNVRDAIVLFEISGLSLEEIRQIQGGSLSGVKSRIARGRKQLARLLGVRDDAQESVRMVENNTTERTHYRFARTDASALRANTKSTIL